MDHRRYRRNDDQPRNDLDRDGRRRDGGDKHHERRSRIKENERPERRGKIEERDCYHPRLERGNSPKITRVKITTRRLQEELPKIFDCRVIDAFVGDYSPTQAISWITAFNIQSHIQLRYEDRLENSLFVIGV